MLVLTLSIFVLPIGEDTADVQIVFDLLEDVVIFDKSFNGGNSKDSRVLTISRLALWFWTMWFAMRDILSSDI